MTELLVYLLSQKFSKKCTYQISFCVIKSTYNLPIQFFKNGNDTLVEEMGRIKLDFGFWSVLSNSLGNLLPHTDCLEVDKVHKFEISGPTENCQLTFKEEREI